MLGTHGVGVIPRRYRLRGSKSIAAVLSEGERARSGPVRAVARESRGTGYSKRGEAPSTPRYKIAVVATRGFKSAVRRNRARRRVKAAVWESRQALREGFEYVVIAGPGAERIPAEELRKIVKRVLVQAGRSRQSPAPKLRGESRSNGNLSGNRKLSKRKEEAWGQRSGRTRLSVSMIRIYQRTVSPLLGSHCRYLPTCSEYAIEALTEYGFFAGWLMAARRVLRCHPWAAGGYDPVRKREVE